MPSITTLKAIGGLGGATEDIQKILQNRLEEERLGILREEGQRRQQSLDDYRKSQQAKIDYDIEQDRLQRQRLEEFLKNPNLTQEQRLMVEYALATGQSAAKGAFEDPEAAERKRYNELGTQHIYKMEELAAGGSRGTAGERAIPPDFAAGIAKIKADNPNAADALRVYDEKVNSGQFFDLYGYGINPVAGRNLLSDTYRKEQLAGGEQPSWPARAIKRVWNETLQKWGDYLPPEATENLGPKGGPPAAPGPGGTPGPTVIPGLRAIPEIPFQDMGEVPIGPLPSAPRSSRGAPSTGGPSGEEIWSRLGEAGAPGAPELPSAETIFNLLNQRASQAPGKPGVTTRTPRVKGKGKRKPVRLKERLQIEGYDVIPMR
jgi:hypothetical protein